MRLIGLAVVLTLSLVLAPLTVEAQQAGKVYRIGVLAGTPPDAPRWSLFREGLRQLGYIEGQTMAVEWRISGGRAERFPELAAELAPQG